jgi:hypothetical protein
MTDLSPAALAIWEAFNSEEPGVFVDYGDCLAAALRAAADWVAPRSVIATTIDYGSGANNERIVIRSQLLAIAAEFETFATEDQ